VTRRKKDGIIALRTIYERPKQKKKEEEQEMQEEDEEIKKR
jgi:hypothetical protein